MIFFQLFDEKPLYQDTFSVCVWMYKCPRFKTLCISTEHTTLYYRFYSQENIHVEMVYTYILMTELAYQK